MPIVLPDIYTTFDPRRRGDLTVTFIGTATLLVSCAGFTFLTDPNFLHKGERAYVGMGLSSRRLTEPALSVEELPPLDFVLLSHHHGDHFDRRAACGLDKDLPIVTEAHAARKLRAQGFERPLALTTWESQAFERGGERVQVTAVPAKHANAPLDRVVPPVMGSVVDFTSEGEALARLYITGDTLLFDRLGEIATRFPGIDVCILHLGGARIANVALTMDGRDGVEALHRLAPRAAIPVHFDDYGLFRSPLREFSDALEGDPAATEAVYLERGQSHTFSAAALRPKTHRRREARAG